MKKIIINAQTGEVQAVDFSEEELQQAELNSLASEKAGALEELAALDIKSIRAMREFIATQPGAPQFIIDYEQAAAAARAKL